MFRRGVPLSIYYYVKVLKGEGYPSTHPPTHRAGPGRAPPERSPSYRDEETARPPATFFDRLAGESPGR